MNARVTRGIAASAAAAAAAIADDATHLAHPRRPLRQVRLFMFPSEDLVADAAKIRQEGRATISPIRDGGGIWAWVSRIAGRDLLGSKHLGEHRVGALAGG